MQVLWLCLSLRDSDSLKILDNISVLISTKKNMIPIAFLVFHLVQTLGTAKGFINLITK